MTIEALRKIYKRSPLKWPKEIQCDEGSEFKGEFNKDMMARKIQIRRGIPGNHRSQGIVENFNKLLSQRLFAYQYDMEFYGGRNTEWVNRLPMVVRGFNQSKSIGMVPADAIKQKHTYADGRVHSHRAITNCNPLFGKKVRYLYAPGEAEGDSRQRATDPIWSLSGTFKIKHPFQIM